jgi:hypothetical protein
MPRLQKLTVDFLPGNIVRQGPNSLAFFTHTANAEIYGVRSNVSKTDGYATMSPSSQPNLISAVDKSVHAWKRRVISQAMSDSFLKEMQSRVVAHIRGFVAMLGSEADVPEGKPVLDGWAPAKNLGVVCDWLTFDVISDLIYGKAGGMLHSPELRWLPGTFQRISQRSATVCGILDDGSTEGLLTVAFVVLDATQPVPLQARSLAAHAAPKIVSPDELVAKQACQRACRSG